MVALLPSCGGGAGPAEVVSCAEDQEVSVSVSPGLRPTFTWEPACGMASLQVWNNATNANGWVVYSGSNSAANPLRPGVSYGQAPIGSIAPGPASPLQAGEAYTVEMYRWIGDPGIGSLFPRGSAVFTP
jgi:hypothetical protein